MLILFTGGRGSGKSTIALELYKLLDKNDFSYVHQSKWRENIDNLFLKIIKILYFLIFFRFDVCGVFIKRFCRDLFKGRSRGSFSRIYMPCIFSYHIKKLNKNKENCVIYESDFLTWNADKVIDSIFDPIEIKNYYSSVILPRVGKIIIVVCDTPIKESFRRWSVRENQVLSKNEIHKWIEKRKIWRMARNRVINEISRISNIEIIKLNGLESAKKNSNIIMDFLIQLK